MRSYEAGTSRASANKLKQAIELDTLESVGLPDGGITSVPFLGEHADLD
jgi:hypothetical protein